MNYSKYAIVFVFAGCAAQVEAIDSIEQHDKIADEMDVKHWQQLMEMEHVGDRPYMYVFNFAPPLDEHDVPQGVFTYTFVTKCYKMSYVLWKRGVTWDSPATGVGPGEMWVTGPDGEKLSIQGPRATYQNYTDDDAYILHTYPGLFGISRCKPLYVTPPKRLWDKVPPNKWGTP